MTGRGQNEVRLRDQGTGIGTRLLLMTNRKSYIVFTLQIGTSVTERGQNEVEHFLEGCNLETLADRAMVTINIE